MEIKIKRMSQNAKIPTQGHIGDAGYDLYACDIPNGKADIEPHKTYMVNTGIALAIPEGYAGLIFPRSGLASKRGVRPANCVGLVDAPYRGPVIVACHNDSANWQTIEDGERVAQLVIVKVNELVFTEVEELDETARGFGGFGSTGK